MPGRPSSGAGNFLSDGVTPQISLAYCAMVRSEENLPDPAIFNIHFFVHSIGFFVKQNAKEDYVDKCLFCLITLNNCSTRSWALTYSA